jgi:hypothetical protein
LHEGFGIYGQAGKAGWTIARGFIAIAMDQGGSFKMRRQVVHLIPETHPFGAYAIFGSGQNIVHKTKQDNLYQLKTHLIDSNFL